MNILKIHMVAVSVIQGVSMSIIGEKRLGKPPLPSGGLTIQPPYSTPMGPWGGWGGGRGPNLDHPRSRWQIGVTKVVWRA